MVFSGDREVIAGSLGSTLSFDLELAEGEILDGLVFVGEEQGNLENLREKASEGLVVLGNMDRFDLQQWTDFLAGFNSDESGSEGMGSTIEFVDLQIENFQLYSEELDDVNMHITPDLAQDNWKIALQSESVAGEVRLPFDQEDYLNIDLQYLRLPAEEGDLIGPIQEAGVELLLDEEEDPVDVLADIDPRELSRMHFSTKEFLSLIHI